MNLHRVFSVVALLFLVALVLPALPAAASDSPDRPVVQVIESTQDGLTLDVQVDGLATNEILQGGTLYHQLRLPFSGLTSQVGLPALPTFGRLVAVPRGAQVQIEILEATSETTSNVLVYPAQPPQTDCALDTDGAAFVIDKEFYSQDEVYPGPLVMAEEIKSLRGVPVTVLRFLPYQYNPARRELTAYSHFRVQVQFVGATGPFADERHRAESFEVLYQRLLLNYEQLGAPQPTAIPRSPTGAEFLIISAPEFVSTANDLAAWRNLNGIDTEVRTTNESGTTAAQIQAYIQDAYDTWNPAPEFVLFVGDHEHIPTTYGGTVASDLYYFTVDGSDYYPDIHGGRISVDSLAEAQNAISNIIDYDLDPVADEAFYDNVSHAAYFQDDDLDGYEDRRFVLTSEDMRDYLLAEGYTAERIYYTHSYVNPTHYNNGTYANGEPLPPDLLRPGFAWDGDEADITAAIEAGRFLLTHRDHGYTGGWGDPAYNIANVLALTNGELLPVVWSMNCQSGWFDGTTPDPCFAEAWLRNPNGGAVGIVAATRNSYSGYNDWMTLGLVDAIWPDFSPEDIPGFGRPEYRMGVVLNYGKLFMTVTWGDPWGLQQTEFELFHYFGDPAMGIHIAPPFPDYTIAIEEDTFDVCVPEVVSTKLQLGQISNFTETVSFEVMGVPSGVTAQVDPVTVTPPATATLTLDISDAALEGTYGLVVSATAHVSNVHTAQVELMVSTGAPGTPAPLSPANGASGQPYRNLTLEWDPMPRVQDYALQLAAEPRFVAPLVDVSDIPTNTYTLETVLDTASCYFWRMAAENVCGEGAWSEPFHFATQILGIGFQDDMESGDGQWSHQASQGMDEWELSTALSHSPTHAWYVPDDPFVTDSYLWNSTPLPMGNGSVLTFWHRHQFQGTGSDGAVLEISADGGATWTDLGPYITANGYGGTISSSNGNPLGGRQAWTGDLLTWKQVEVDLDSFAGQSVQIRWRIGCDDSMGDTGWFIDDVQITAPLPPGPAPAVLGVTPDIGFAGEDTAMQIEGTGFVDTPHVKLGDTWLVSVTQTSSTTLDVVVPGSLATGVYTLTIYNGGDCQEATLSEAFTIVTEPQYHYTYLPLVIRDADS